MDEFSSAEQALAAAHRVVQTLAPDDLDRRTPCPDWDVTALGEHMVDTISRLGAAVGIASDPHGDSIGQRIQRVTEPIVAGWRPRGLTDDVVFAGRTLPARLALGIVSLELVVHAWGFAVALDRPLAVSDALAAHVLGLAQQTLTTESRVTAGFNPPVPVADDASPLDQLVAFTGRNPAQSRRFIDVDGARLCADVRSGKAPALVFLHWSSCTTGEVHGGPGGRCSDAWTLTRPS